MPYDTLEEAQARILELDEQIKDKDTQINSLSDDKKKLETDNENLRTLNQKYFNKLIAQDEKKDGKKEPEEVKTCEEFALTLEI